MQTLNALNYIYAQDTEKVFDFTLNADAMAVLESKDFLDAMKALNAIDEKMGIGEFKIDNLSNDEILEFDWLPVTFWLKSD